MEPLEDPMFNLSVFGQKAETRFWSKRNYRVMYSLWLRIWRPISHHSTTVEQAGK